MFNYIYPVSYTHLDVYKRQLLNRKAEIVPITRLKSASANNGILLFSSKIGSPSLFITKIPINTMDMVTKKMRNTIAANINDN